MDIFFIEEDEPSRRTFIESNKRQKQYKLQDPFKIEEHELVFFQRTKDKHKDLILQLDNFLNNDLQELIISCKNSFERAIVHIACKLRKIYSVRTSPETVTAICKECKDEKRLAKYSGKFYYEYEYNSNSCRNCENPMVILHCHIEGVKIMKSSTEQASKRNQGINRNNNVRYTNNYNNKTRQSLIIQILHTSGFNKDLKRLLYSYLKSDDKYIDRPYRDKELQCW